MKVYSNTAQSLPDLLLHIPCQLAETKLPKDMIQFLNIYVHKTYKQCHLLQ